MPNYNRVWASAAQAPENISEPDAGAVEAGHGTVSPPKHNWENWVKNQIVKGLQELQRNAALSYNAAVPYDRGVVARYNNNSYFSLENGNQNNRPDTSPEQWYPLPGDGFGVSMGNVLGLAEVMESWNETISPAGRADNVVLGGSFGDQVVNIRMINGIVTIASPEALTHSSLSGPQSASQVIPPEFLPVEFDLDIPNLPIVSKKQGYGSSRGSTTVQITRHGSLAIIYSDSSGESVNRSNSSEAVCISYLVHGVAQGTQ